MPANVYECMFLLDTNKVAGDVSAAAKQLHDLLERNESEMLASRPWDDRRLAGLSFHTMELRAGGR